MSKKKNTAKIIGAYNVVQQGVYNVIIKYGGVEEKRARIITNTILLIILAVLCGVAIYGFSILNSKLDAIRNDSAKEDKAVYSEITTTSPLITIESTESTLPLATTNIPTTTTAPPETTQTTTLATTTTLRPVQTTPPPSTTPQHTESAVTPPETIPPETTVATTTTLGVGVENDFEYSLVNGQEAVLTRYIGSQTEVVIPSTLGGLPVAEIGVSAFENNAALTRIEFPSSLTTIGDRAFAGCTNLLMTDVAIPMKLTRIGNCAFQNSANGIVKLPSNTSMTEIGERAFYECCATKIVLYNIQTIHNEAFAECNNLDTVYLPISLKTVGDDVFFGKDANPDMPVLSFFGNNNTWSELYFTDQDPEGNSEDRNRIWQYFETMRADRENEISQNGSSNIKPVLQFNSKYYE